MKPSQKPVWRNCEVLFFLAEGQPRGGLRCQWVVSLIRFELQKEKAAFISEGGLHLCRQRSEFILSLPKRSHTPDACSTIGPAGLNLRRFAGVSEAEPAAPSEAVEGLCGRRSVDTTTAFQLQTTSARAGLVSVRASHPDRRLADCPSNHPIGESDDLFLSAAVFDIYLVAFASHGG